jgi:hypothetical protein
VEAFSIMICVLASRSPDPRRSGLPAIVIAACVLAGCRGVSAGNEAAIREALAAKTRVIHLAPGVMEVSAAIEVPEGTHDLEIRGDAAGSTLRVADSFQGRAVFVVRSGRNVHFADFLIDGNRAALERPLELPPSNVTFAEFYANNGIVAVDTVSLAVEKVRFREIANYAIIVSGGSGSVIDGVEVRNSGSRNEHSRNNASGGILLENGAANFTVRNCRLENIRGNGIWTHSRYEAPRNQDGRIVGNRFSHLGRDAIQVGHATRIRVEGNSGSHIGFPLEEVDVESGAMPVAIDTAGNTDQSSYVGNKWQEVNGKCIDLDGFHHGEVRGNTCINREAAQAYPSGHFGIVMNNSNPDMESEQIVVEDNEISGMVYGGIYVIGSGHRISGNRLLHLNKAACREGSADPRCHFWPEEPALLRSGIYLGSRAERPAVTRDNLIEDNEISGFGMAAGCVAVSPGAEAVANEIRSNHCRDESAPLR